MNLHESMTGATLFSGGELCGVGMRQAGIDHRWGIELDPAIAGVAQANGFNVIVADVLTVDPAQMEPADCLHASPVCTRASSANQSAELNEEGTKEAPLDIAMGEKVAQFIDVMQPRIFTLENVFAYRNFKAFKIICAALDRNGYFWDYDNLNAADYGVPQTRRRLILRAVRGALLPNLPQPERWIGWYEAIEDLIPGLPESKFAPWQLERLPVELQTCLIGGGNTQKEFVTSRARLATEPAMTIFTDLKNNGRAFIVDQNYGNPNTGGNERILSIKQGDEPVFTIGAGGQKREIRAWLNDDGIPDDVKAEIDTKLDKVFVEWQAGNTAILVAQGGYDGNVVHRSIDEPSFVITANNNQQNGVRAWLSAGRVVAMTPRALARFQSVPDNYILPTSNKLACTVIGNGVPCLLAEKIYRGLIGT